MVFIIYEKINKMTDIFMDNKVLNNNRFEWYNFI